MYFQKLTDLVIKVRPYGFEVDMDTISPRKDGNQRQNSQMPVRGRMSAFLQRNERKTYLDGYYRESYGIWGGKPYTVPDSFFVDRKYLIIVGRDRYMAFFCNWVLHAR